MTAALFVVVLGAALLAPLCAVWLLLPFGTL